VFIPSRVRSVLATTRRDWIGAQAADGSGATLFAWVRERTARHSRRRPAALWRRRRGRVYVGLILALEHSVAGIAVAGDVPSAKRSLRYLTEPILVPRRPKCRTIGNRGSASFCDALPKSSILLVTNGTNTGLTGVS
jgi:hypothetical protein